MSAPALRVLFAFAQNVYSENVFSIAPMYDDMVFAAEVPVSPLNLRRPDTERRVLRDLELAFQTAMRTVRLDDEPCWTEAAIDQVRVMSVGSQASEVNGVASAPFVLARAADARGAVETSGMKAWSETMRQALEAALKVPVVELTSAAAETLDRDPRGVAVTAMERAQVAHVLANADGRLSDARQFHAVVDAAFRAPVFDAHRERRALEAEAGTGAAPAVKPLTPGGR